MEFLYVQQYLWVPYLPTNQLYINDSTIAPFYCRGTQLTAFFAFITQFSLLGSELCFFIISVDLRKAYTNPFTSFQQNKWVYLLTVLVLSIATGILVVLCGPQVYGPSSIGVIWIQGRRQTHSPNYPQFLLYYFPSIIIFVYCLWANFQYYRGLEKGLAKTVGNRVSIMERSKRYTATYVAYGVVIFIIEFIEFIYGHSHEGVAPVASYFYALRGVWGLIIIIYSNYREISLDELNPCRSHHTQDLIRDFAKEKLLLQPHLNTALRAEILFFATQGIIHAALEGNIRRVKASNNSNNNNNDNNNNNNQTNHDGNSSKKYSRKPTADGGGDSGDNGDEINRQISQQSENELSEEDGYEGQQIGGKNDQDDNSRMFSYEVYNDGIR
jgi:hypothetical protein